MSLRLLPRSLAIRVATRPSASNDEPGLIGIALFEVEEHSPGAFTFSLQVQTLVQGQSEIALFERMKPPAFPPAAIIGYDLVELWDALQRLASAAPPVLSFLDTLTAAGDKIDLGELASRAATSFAEICEAEGVPSWGMAEEEVLAAWNSGRRLELIGMLATDAVACWRLWAAKERPGDEMVQRFAREAIATWAVGEDRTFVWHPGEGVRPQSQAKPTPTLDIGHMQLVPAAPATIPSTAYVRPCHSIPVEQMGPIDGVNSPLSERYHGLTDELPLAGAAMMRTNANGEIQLVARLRASAPWLEPAIEKIDQALRIQNWAGRPWLAWRPLLLSGPPGIGKSYLARLIGELAQSGHAILDLGGVSDNRTLEGTARGWTSAQPCWPAVVMNQTRTANPVLLLEEVEKAGGSARSGVPHATLLGMIEAETAKDYWDKCLLAEVDLSHCCWLLTANFADLLPGPLRSRIDVVEVQGPGPEHFDTIVAAVLRDLAVVWNVPIDSIPDLPTSAYRLLRQAFAKHRSARRLRRHLEQLISTMIRDVHGRTH